MKQDYLVASFMVSRATFFDQKSYFFIVTRYYTPLHQTSSKQVPCLQRTKHELKETCNFLQRAGETDSCRLGREKKPQWGKNANLRTTKRCRQQNHRTGSMFAARKAWTKGNLQPFSVSRGDRFLQARKREKTPVGINANLRTTKKYRPQNY